MPENLRKSRTNKVIAGVCGGIAEYFKVDPTLIRLAWALAFFVGGSGLVLYILAVIIMPEELGANVETVHKEQNEATSSTETKVSAESESKRNQILGLILVVVGAYFMLQRFFPFFNMHNWWPVILIIIGLFILVKGKVGADK